MHAYYYLNHVNHYLNYYFLKDGIPVEVRTVAAREYGYHTVPPRLHLTRFQLGMLPDASTAWEQGRQIGGGGLIGAALSSHINPKVLPPWKAYEDCEG